MQCAVQCNAVKCSKVHCCAVCSAVQFHTVLYCIVVLLYCCCRHRTDMAVCVLGAGCAPVGLVLGLTEGLGLLQTGTPHTGAP